MDVVKQIVDQLAELGQRFNGPIEINGIPAVILEQDKVVEDFARFMERPTRVDADVYLQTEEAFIDYYNRYCGDNSVIFCDLKSGEFRAVLDYHESPEAPRWGSHTATFVCETTQEWGDWRKSDKKLMPQVEFADFIEEHVEDIIDPEGAVMLEIASTLQAKTSVSFRSGVRLDNGQVQYTYAEDTDGAAGPLGNLQIPQRIKIGVRLFEGGTGYEIEARFRYRITEGKLYMSYHLIRPHKAHERAVMGTFSKIKEEMAKGMILRGKA